MAARRRDLNDPEAVTEWMAQSPADASADGVPTQGDLDIAPRFRERIARLARAATPAGGEPRAGLRLNSRARRSWRVAGVSVG